MNDLFMILYNLFGNIATIASTIWEWLNKDFEVNLFGFNVLTLFGIETFKPIQITGAVILIFLAARIIKEFIPLA